MNSSKLQSKNLKKILFSLAILSLTFITGAKNLKIAAAQDLTSRAHLKPDYELFLDKDYLYVDLIIESDYAAFNATSATLKFETNKLSIQGISYENSFCKFFVKEEIDNTNGELKIACGSPENSAGAQKIARLKFNKLEEGLATINIADALILENDGLGTALNSDNEIHRIYLVK